MFGTFQASRQPLLPMRPVSLGRDPMAKNLIKFQTWKIINNKIKNVIFLFFNKKTYRRTRHDHQKLAHREYEDGHPGLNDRVSMSMDSVAFGSLDWKRRKDEILKEMFSF
jgi:hypothetical protein